MVNKTDISLRKHIMSNILAESIGLFEIAYNG